MKARLFLVLVFLLGLSVAYGQTDNTVYVKSFPGRDVGAKVSAAMRSCGPNAAVPCILVIDPSLAAAPAGVMPSLASNVHVYDYRAGNPFPLLGVAASQVTPGIFGGGIYEFTDGLQLGGGPTNQPRFTLVGTQGVSGNRLRLAGGIGGSAEMEFLPGAGLDASNHLAVQLQMFMESGNDYSRLDFTGVNHQWIIDTTYNGAGTAYNLYFQAGGSVSNNIAGQNAIEMTSDASVLLNGSTYSYAGKTWGVNRTTVGDWAETGNSALIIDTRTASQANNPADGSWIEFRRGNGRKWLVGLNVAGGNADAYQIWNQVNGFTAFSISAAGAMRSKNNTLDDGSGNMVAVGSVTAGGGALVVLRCTSAGALPVGAFTLDAASCGGSAATGLIVK